MLASAFLFAVLDGLIKLLGPPFRIWDIAFYRFAGGLAILVLIVGRNHNPFAGHNRKLLIIRGITGSCAFLALVTAIRLIPISTALVLFFSFPAFAAFFSPLFFKEPITWAEIVSVVIALVGVALLFDFRLEGGILGQAMAVLGGAFAGLTVGIIKKLREKNGPVVIYLYFCLLGSVISFPAFIAHPQIPQVTSEYCMLCSGRPTPNEPGIPLLQELGRGTFLDGRGGFHFHSWHPLPWRTSNVALLDGGFSGVGQCRSSQPR
jgi:drug/metabolite transporter (DMT)-like permease